MGKHVPPAMQGIDMKVVALEGPQTGKGAKVDFVVNGRSTETWEILESTTDEQVVYAIDFKVMIVRRTITLKSLDGGATEVTWHETGEVEDLAAMGAEIVKNFDEALAGVKRLAETD